jgi:SAM-dependent methyltransferase
LSDDPTTNKYTNKWALGSYNEIALFLLPVSAHLVRLCNISYTDNVLDVACGTGNTAITAKRLANAKVVGVDFTPELLAQAKEQASLAEVEDIEWKEGNVEDLPFEDESFDVVLSSFGHMFSPHPEVAIKEMLRVTKGDGGRIAFATWPAELANGRLFAAIAKHVSYPSVDNEIHPPPPPPPSPILWGIPEVIQKRLGNGKVKHIHFERGAINKPIVSPNHWWKMSSTTAGSLIHTIQILNEPQKIELLRQDVLEAITPYIKDNVLRLDYLVTVSIKI